ncbi:type IV pilus biogenesis protein PilM (plasmid) [Dyella sp. BiH032]|uniref:type IV pilus biogenesis protein PilM n=1 Tax=Dyella sp. BiH032 TaxID=3075430 RepID=UPI0028932BE5|nr:type IV pilus biogenesis protein PilM [Dyella sp. BiH032]WNL48548.1 type IV pilus biogenesis protein PilM [Dyella sp. BiH032]
MYTVMLTCMLLIASIFISSVDIARARQTLHDSEVTNVTLMLEQIGTFGSKYAQANAGTTSAVSFASAGAPSWFVAWPGAGLYVRAGTSYAYTPAANLRDPAGIVAKVREQGLVAGVSSGTNLLDGLGNVVASLPSGIPNNSVVVVQ